MSSFHPEQRCGAAIRHENRPAVAPALPALVLRVQYLRKPVEDHVLRLGTNTVGRHPDNDVVVRGAFVSRRHCAILVYPSGCCEIHDLGSAHGVHVNGQRIAGLTRLRPGDQVSIGGLLLVLLCQEEAADHVGQPGWRPDVCLSLSKEIRKKLPAGDAPAGRLCPGD